MTCQACCPKCGMHFSGDKAFELHLGGPDTDWHHRDPRDVLTKTGAPRLAMKTREGECRLGFETLHGVTIWEQAGTAERTAQFSARISTLPPSLAEGDSDIVPAVAAA